VARFRFGIAQIEGQLLEVLKALPLIVEPFLDAPELLLLPPELHVPERHALAVDLDLGADGLQVAGELRGQRLLGIRLRRKVVDAAPESLPPLGEDLRSLPAVRDGLLSLGEVATRDRQLLVDREKLKTKLFDFRLPGPEVRREAVLATRRLPERAFHLAAPAGDRRKAPGRERDLQVARFLANSPEPPRAADLARERTDLTLDLDGEIGDALRSRSAASSFRSASRFRTLYFMMPDASSNSSRRRPPVSSRMASIISRSKIA
jgi:hypothetical protein